MITIAIATDFSKYPGARYPEEGPFSGSEFRTKILVPNLRLAIKNNDILTVDLDGTEGYGTSFLEEAFGGLIREDRFSIQDLQQHLLIKSDESDFFIEDIKQYITEANEKESKK